MDDKGRLIIYEDGKEKFRGKTFAENVLVEEECINRKERRRLAAERKKIEARLHKLKQTT